MLRLLVPYVLIAWPFFLFMFVQQEESFINLLGELSTFKFWLSGNYYSMWYVSLSLVLYLLFPLIYKVLTTEKINYHFAFILLLILSFTITETVRILTPDYWTKVSIAISKLPCFLLGAYLGRCIDDTEAMQKRIFIVILLMSLVLTVVFAFLYIQPGGEYLYFYMCDSLRIITIFIVVIVMNWLSRFKFQININRCLSWFGFRSLELYLLHVLLLSFISLFINKDWVVMILAISIAILLCSLYKDVSKNICVKFQS